MHDTKDHISDLCPACGKEALFWLKQDIHCDACECSWTHREFIEECKAAERIDAPVGDYDHIQSLKEAAQRGIEQTLRSY